MLHRSSRTRLLQSVAAALALLPILACAGEGKKVPAAEAGDAKASGVEGGPLSRNLANTTEKGILHTFSVKKGATKNVKWSAQLGTRAYGGPVVAAGRIFIGTNNDRPRDPKVKGDLGVMLCLKESDGSFLWQHTHELLEEPNNAPREGIASSPWVEKDRLWYVSNRAEVICSDLDGKIQWKYDMVKELDVFVGQLVYTSPLVIGDLVYALTCNGVDAGTGKLPKPKAPALVALNKTTGKLAWSNGLPGENVMRGQWSNPTGAVVNGKAQVIYGGGDGYLYSLDARTGELIWKFDCNPKGAKPYKPGGSGEKSFIIATPVIDDNKCYVGVGQEPDGDGDGVGHLWCIDITKTPKNKDKDLSPVGDNFDPKAPVNKDSGLVWHLGGYVTPKPKAGEREFVFGRTLSTVAVHDGLVYAVEYAGFLHCADAKTGKVYWTHDFQENTWCSPYYVDGKVFVGTDSGDFYAFQAGKKLVELSKVPVGHGIKMPPLADKGVLYLIAAPYLYAIGK